MQWLGLFGPRKDMPQAERDVQIATRVEIFTGNLPPGNRDAESCAWKRLGFLSFDKNERSGYQARELKSVHVNTSAYLLKLVVQRCHPNKLNTDNQVSIFIPCAYRLHQPDLLFVRARNAPWIVTCQAIPSP